MTEPTTKKPSTAVYRRRRLVALVGVIAVIALMWWFVTLILGLFSGNDRGEDRGDENPTAVETTAAPAETDPGQTQAAPVETTPQPTESTPEPDPTPRACTEAEVTVTANLDKDSYGDDEDPQISATIENTSDSPCLMDVGTASQQYVIMSGTDTIWVSTHCQTDSTTQVVELLPGKVVDAPAIPWVRERSAPDTCDSDSRPQAVAGGSYYYLTVKIGGITSAEAYFSLN